MRQQIPVGRRGRAAVTATGSAAPGTPGAAPASGDGESHRQPAGSAAPPGLAVSGPGSTPGAVPCTDPPWFCPEETHPRSGWSLGPRPQGPAHPRWGGLRGRCPVLADPWSDLAGSRRESVKGLLRGNAGTPAASRVPPCPRRVLPCPPAQTHAEHVSR